MSVSFAMPLFLFGFSSLCPQSSSGKGILRKQALLHTDHGALKLMLSPVALLAQASDPSTFELIQKIHTLQKRLISKTEEVVEKELLLQVCLPACAPQTNMAISRSLRTGGLAVVHASS